MYLCTHKSLSGDVHTHIYTDSHTSFLPLLHPRCFSRVFSEVLILLFLLWCLCPYSCMPLSLSLSRSLSQLYRSWSSGVLSSSLTWALVCMHEPVSSYVLPHALFSVIISLVSPLPLSFARFLTVSLQTLASFCFICVLIHTNALEEESENVCGCVWVNHSLLLVKERMDGWMDGWRVRGQK